MGISDYKQTRLCLRLCWMENHVMGISMDHIDVPEEGKGRKDQWNIYAWNEI